MRTVFPTTRLRDQAVENYHAIEGGEQTLSNLAAYVAEIAQKKEYSRAWTRPGSRWSRSIRSRRRG